MTGDKPTTSDQAAVDALGDGVLKDPAVWVQPPAGLQEQVVAAIAEAQGGTGRRRFSVGYTLLGAAAAVVLVLGVVVGLVAIKDNETVQFTAAMSGTELAPQASGEVRLTRSDSGWRIYLDASGLPRRADGAYYEAWLKNAEGVLVPIGTFNEPHDVMLWAGVSPRTHPTITVTRELADSDASSSGQVVLKGTARLEK